MDFFGSYREVSGTNDLNTRDDLSRCNGSITGIALDIRFLSNDTLPRGRGEGDTHG